MLLVLLFCLLPEPRGKDGWRNGKITRSADRVTAPRAQIQTRRIFGLDVSLTITFVVISA